MDKSPTPTATRRSSEGDKPPVDEKPIIKTEVMMISSSPQKLLPSPTKISLPPMPPSTLVGNWILHEHSFAPQREYFMSFCAQLSRRRVVDHLMSFRFPQEDLEPVAVHYSRLALAGGPMAALLREKKEEDVVMGSPGRENDKENDKNDSAKKRDGRGKPAEKEVSSEKEADEKEADPMLDDEPSLVRTPDSPRRKSPVLLSDDDSPRVFNIIVKFLYCEEVQFNYLTFQEVVQLAVAAHRWQLTDLYNATFAYVMDQNLLADGLGIRTFIPLVSHAETPEAFRRYFCIAVGHHFDVLYPRLKAISLTESTAPVSLSVPPLWDVIVSQNMLSHVIHCIGLYSKESYDQYLLDVILRYFEPKKGSTEEELQGLLSQLNWDEIELSETFASDGPSKNWSARAIRMAALASFDAPQTQALEVRIPWNIPLQKLLKENTWSFQTEHVLCGPYVCYLHVRKGTGPEVSLFVHIWYRDGKPIGADARHESVRVKCRATERNCRCDSGRQWSNTSHGFLENLSFEGKLEGYPGLGWSQFLEAKRIEEWRTSHGEGCGLAITTVLQFMRPKKQFEGPARRSLRAPSPGRVVSAIQKKHSRPSTRMKLRESR